MRLFTFTLFIFLVHSASAYTIAVDAGHGGVDTGATFGNVRESDVVLGVSKQLSALINQEGQFHAFLTRENNGSVELKQRIRTAKKNATNLFVSIHANSSPDPHSQGMEIYFRNELEPDEESLRLASQENLEESGLADAFPQRKNKSTGDLNSILQDLKRSVTSLKSYELSWHILKKWQVPFSKPRNNAIKQGPFHVINHQDFPSVLVEIGFVSNVKEAKRLASPEYQKEIAEAIYRGLKDYKESLDANKSLALSGFPQ